MRTFLEVLVFDDASIAGSGTIASELAVQDERVRVFHNPRWLNIGGIYKVTERHRYRRRGRMLGGIVRSASRPRVGS